jgi:spermidine synthase
MECSGKEMRINAPIGQKVSYVRHDQEPWGGDDAREILNPGGIYTVQETLVFRSSSFVRLVEHTEHTFNTVLFDEVGELLPELQSDEEIYLEGLSARQQAAIDRSRGEE